jgi:hypothetical protein
VDLLADSVREQNSVTLHNPLTVNSQSTEQQPYHLVRQGAIFMAPFQQGVYALRQAANKKVFRIRLMTEKQRSFGDHAPVV